MRIIAFILAALAVSPIFGQFGIDTDYWNFQKYNDISKSAVRLEVSGILGGGFGSGSIIELSEAAHSSSEQMVKAYVLTAAHVIGTGSTLTVYYQGGGKYEAVFIDKFTVDKPSDLAIVTVYAPRKYSVLEIAQAMEVGEDVYVTGYGGPLDKVDVEKPRFFRSKIARIAKDSSQILVSCDVVAGDSGGPITNSKGEVLGVVSGGMFWCVDKDLDHPTTWPTRSGSHLKIRELLEKHKKSGK